MPRFTENDFEAESGRWSNPSPKYYDARKMSAMLHQAAVTERTLAQLRVWLIDERDAASRIIKNTIVHAQLEAAWAASTGLHAAYRATLARVDALLAGEAHD
jgi:hypothetical protein